jgi:hypothetical protein
MNDEIKIGFGTLIEIYLRVRESGGDLARITAIMNRITETVSNDIYSDVKRALLECNPHTWVDKLPIVDGAGNPIDVVTLDGLSFQ